MQKWINQYMKQWIDQKTINHMYHWISGPSNQRSTEWTNERVNKLMDEWLVCRATSSVSDLVVEPPLLSATSSLRSLLSGLPLLWSASWAASQPKAPVVRPYVAMHVASPHGTRAAQWWKEYCPRSCYTANASSNSSCKPACQERGNITSTFLRAAVSMRFAVDRLQARKIGVKH